MNGADRFVYVSMDAFTKDLGQIGVPTAAGLKGGNVEFWPDNYGHANAAGVPGASTATWDFGDEPVEPRDGYGSMQVHDHDAGRTLFALNGWKSGAGADLGIGSQAVGNPDWTFAANARTYAVKRLRVLVRCR